MDYQIISHTMIISNYTRQNVIINLSVNYLLYQWIIINYHQLSFIPIKYQSIISQLSVIPTNYQSIINIINQLPGVIYQLSAIPVHYQLLPLNYQLYQKFSIFTSYTKQLPSVT